MAQFEPLKDELNQMGASIVHIAAQKREGFFNPVKFLDKHPISFPFLLDEDRSITKSYGLYHRIGKDAINIAHPATLVVDHDGVIRYIYRGESQSDRAPIEEVLQALTNILGSTESS